MLDQLLENVWEEYNAVQGQLEYETQHQGSKNILCIES
jgi:hypothetical protein